MSPARRIYPREWRWRRYRLREGEFKDLPWGAPRPDNVPPESEIPQEWHKDLKAYLAKRKPKPDPPAPQVPPSFADGLGGWIRNAGNCTVDHPEAVAFIEAARLSGKTPWVSLQFGDPATEQRNLRALKMEGWATRWNAVGAIVYGWWRVEHRLPATQPPVNPYIRGWMPNPEQPPELAVLPNLMLSNPQGIITLPKTPLIDVRLFNVSRAILFTENFRESDTSDGTISESEKSWRQRGLDMELWRPVLQCYGIPFSPLRAQTLEAKQCKARGISFYPLDGAHPQAIKEAGEEWVR